jgi:hypothetical protein
MEEPVDGRMHSTLIRGEKGAVKKSVKKAVREDRLARDEGVLKVIDSGDGCI